MPLLPRGFLSPDIYPETPIPRRPRRERNGAFVVVSPIQETLKVPEFSILLSPPLQAGPRVNALWWWCLQDQPVLFPWAGASSMPVVNCLSRVTISPVRGLNNPTLHPSSDLQKGTLYQNGTKCFCCRRFLFTGMHSLFFLKAQDSPRGSKLQMVPPMRVVM